MIGWYIDRLVGLIDEARVFITTNDKGRKYLRKIWSIQKEIEKSVGQRFQKNVSEIETDWLIDWLKRYQPVLGYFMPRRLGITCFVL